MKSSRRAAPDRTTPQSRPAASIIVVNFNGRELLEPCLAAALQQAGALGAELIVVDNASSDGSAAFVRDRFPEVHLVCNRRNEGFAGGCNAGVAAAKGEIVVLLNNDAIPQPGWLQSLLDAMEPPDVAIAASVVEEARYPSSYELGTGSISVIGHPIPNVCADPARPFYATGCSLAFKRPCFPTPFDPVYFAYYEDTLLSWRAHLRGLRVVRAVDSRVTHLGSATASRLPSTALYYWERNRLLTLLLCYEAPTLVKLAPLFLLDGLARSLEDVWRLSTGRQDLSATLRRSRASAQAMAWLFLHPRQIAGKRRSVQATRVRGDGPILRLLSGKIFDDQVPTRAHSIANAIAVGYCRMAHIRTAEQR